MNELQHEKEVLDLELLHERQEAAKKDSTIQTLEYENTSLSEKIATLNRELQDMECNVKKQSEGMYKNAVTSAPF